MDAAIDRRLKALGDLLRSERPRSVIETQAIQRQIEDLQHGHERGLCWDEHEAARTVAFFGELKHWKGKFAGKPMTLEPWQEHCIIAPLFGWMREKLRSEGGIRRFRTAYIEVPRKNGKTTLASGIGNQALVADGESGAEVYAAATKRDQAAILFKDSKETLGKRLRKMVDVFVGSIVCPRLNSSFKPLSSDYNSLDGLNVHRAIVDELHAHKTRDLWDVLDTATGARTQPMLVAITTAGYDRSSICWEQREIVRKILEKHQENDAFFGFVATTDDGDDWSDPKIWWKANPNLGISLNEDVLFDACKKAKDSPSAENNFRRKHLNQWTEQAVRWLSMDAWDQCKGDVSRGELRSERCYAALDLASTRDVNSLVLLFPRENGQFKLLAFYWVPEEAKDVRANQDRTQVMNWATKGLITKTSGNTTDYATICHDIMGLSEEFRIQGLAYDPSGPAAAVVQMLQSEGFPFDSLRSFSQGWSNFAFPTKEFERLILSRRIEHGGDPVLRWMAGNVTVKPDSNDNIRPDKSKSADKIDGIVASIMAVGLWFSTEGQPDGTYYESHELEMF